MIGRIDTDTGEIIPTAGKRRKEVEQQETKQPDYKKLYEDLQKKSAAQVALIAVLQKEIKALKEKTKA
ncbi:hypothetical protein FACS1894111_12840 [Clostridia bacterium]|nr:hypothetical protein FACS1894111_12840 [Clostridia bacterium]